MRVFVINMREHSDRRDAAREKLDAANVKFEFFDAISGEAAIEQRLFDAVDQGEVLLNTGRIIVPGELGCFASHRALWALAVELNESIMIMEDDFDLLDSFADALRSAENVIDRVGYLRLQIDCAARITPVANCKGFVVSRYTKAPHCMMCYCISSKVAHKFFDDTRVVGAPVDVYVKNFWEHGQPLFALTPYMVAPSIFSPRTTILGRRKGKKSFNVAVRRFLRKGGSYWHRWQFNMRQRNDWDSLSGSTVTQAGSVESMRPISASQKIRPLI